MSSTYCPLMRLLYIGIENIDNPIKPGLILEGGGGRWASKFMIMTLEGNIKITSKTVSFEIHKIQCKMMTSHGTGTGS